MNFSNSAARLLCAFALLHPQAYAAEEAAGEIELDSRNAWFKPALVENRSAICAVLEEANQLFHSKTARIDIVPIHVKGMEVVDPDQGLDQEQVTKPHPRTGKPMTRTQAFVTTHGRRIYVSVRTNQGCGGGCETRQMFASTQPFEPPMPLG